MSVRQNRREELLKSYGSLAKASSHHRCHDESHVCNGDSKPGLFIQQLAKVCAYFERPINIIFEKATCMSI